MLGVWQGKDNAGEVFSLRDLSGEELLRQLPVLQKLQQRMMDCKPGGAAKSDPVVQASLFAVLKESFRIYKAVSEGIINLADKFFEMEYLEAQKGLEIYKESIVDNTRLQVIPTPLLSSKLPLYLYHGKGKLGWTYSSRTLSLYCS